ncbi:MAG: PilN domain-containing protein [Proteobacteria bacterium]|nr:PilN domain-containing protein [Pseudomonadota bacterium]
MATTTAHPPASLASRLGAPLAQARGRYAGSGLQQFLGWWGGELATLLPASWRALFAQARARVLYVPTAEGLELRVEEGDRAIDIGTFAREAQTDDERDRREELRSRIDARLGERRVERPRWLLLPAGQVLRRKITLPAAASDRLRAVVGFELDRQTPFRADQVTYDCRVLAVDAVNKTAQVELVVLPKDRLEAALAALGPLAEGLSGVDACDAGGVPLRCNLLPAERRRPPDHRRLWLHLGLAAIALVALGFAFGRILDNRRDEVTRLHAQVEQRHAQARKVTALIGQLKDAAEGANFLAAHRAAQPPMLAVLADVSSRLPDTTFLERFSQQDNQIFLTGLSTDAASLVAKLQDSPLLRSPALAGSVQPDAASKRDRFTLNATLVSAAPPAPPAAAASASGGSHAASR